MTAPPTEPHGDLDEATVRSYATAAGVAWATFAAMHAVAGRPRTALVHLTAGLLSLAARFVAKGSPSRRAAAILLLSCASLGGLGAAAILSGDPRGPAVTLLALVPLLSGVIQRVTLRRSVLVLSIGTAVAVPIVTTHVPALEPIVRGVGEGIFITTLLGLLVYRFGSEWRVRSDAQVARLTQQQRELADKQAHLSASRAEIEAARDEALRASAAKSRFVAMTSHEIRGPLNGLVGLSHALSDTELSPHQRGIVQALRGSSDALTKVVGDLLDLARVEAGKIELAPSMIDVRELLADVADTFSASTIDKELEVITVVESDVPDGVVIDGARLRQVLANLVGNAAKFTDRGHVLVTGRLDGQTLCIAVSDTGRGISPEDRERLFAPFEQVSDRLLDRQAGTGLGLWLARSFVDAMGGSLEVRSEIGTGSTFEVRLPFRRATVPEIDRASVLASASVLCVVASPLVGRALTTASSRLGLAPAVVLPDAALPHAGSVDHVIIDVDDPAQEARIPAAARLPRREGSAYLCASPRRIARAEDLARRYKLGGVLLKPIRAARIAPLLTRDGAGETRRAGSGQLLLGNLLVVDDEPINRTVVRHLATPLGLTVTEAESGAEALAWLERHPCDVVLLDLHMEGMDGVETARRIRAAHGATPIVLGYSGGVRDDERARFHEAGVAEVLGKPLERTTFETALRAAVGRARRRRTHQSQQIAAAGALGAADALAARAGLTPERRAEALGLVRPSAPKGADAVLEVERLRDLVRFVGASEARRMATELLAELDERVKGITEGARAGRARDVQASAHKLGSVAATFGLSELAAACRAAETEAIAASPTELAQLGLRVAAAVEPSRAALAEALRGPAFGK